MGPGFFPPPNFEMREKLKAQKPKNFKDLGRYLKETVGGTCKRLGYIFKLVWEAKPSLLFVLIFMTVYNGISPLVGTLITANLLAKVVASFSGEVDLLIPLTYQFGFIFLNSLIGSISGMITKISGEVVTNHVKVKIMEKSRTVDVASFDMPDFYERLENANREAGMRPVNILNSTFELVSKVISLVSFIVVLSAIMTRMDSIAYLFFGLFVVLCLVSAAVSFYFRRQNFFYMRRRSKDRRQLSYYSDVLVNKDVVKEVRLFDLSDFFIGRYKDVFKSYFKGIKKLTLKEGFWNIFLSLCTAAMNMVLFYMVATNVKQIDDYSLYTGALNSISSCVASLISLVAGIYEGSLFIDNMILFMNEKQTVVPSIAEPIKPQRHCGHTIELRHVCFAYPGADHDVLHDINLTLEAGDTVMLVGLNGAGKTTLIKLITRLYDPTAGEILLDGRNIKEYDVKELYAIYGIIFQDFGKYALSVSENIALGEIHKPIVRENVEAAARQAGADAYINRLSRTYDTPLMRYFEKDGLELSGGQWQKLSIARAFYSDSDILILDEPTAALDPMAEAEIYHQFDMLRKEKTTVFVSHRLSSATTASKVVVLKDGRIAEIGSHAELMAQHGEYYTLFSTQAKRYITEENEHVLGENDGFPPHGGFPPREGMPPQGGMPPHGEMMPKGQRPPHPFPPEQNRHDDRKND